ncbi:unnamed protein product [Thelazia callipaeda]|uniref:FH2 domain-containing protein n=1 Tax=Thelazia callipaeda TaxID=103827 RepID=A0A0N5D160_THECL|nr:unnamed protein product [Thelazia callipaeda]
MDRRKQRVLGHTMWNSKMGEDDDNRHNEYLEEFVRDSEAHDTFSSEAELGKIVSCLPNWKVAGADGIYNFLIKKCISFHLDLYKIANLLG